MIARGDVNSIRIKKKHGSLLPQVVIANVYRLKEMRSWWGQQIRAHRSMLIGKRYVNRIFYKA
jgi:hypothetical protein